MEKNNYDYDEKLEEITKKIEEIEQQIDKFTKDINDNVNVFNDLFSFEYKKMDALLEELEKYRKIRNRVVQKELNKQVLKK